MSYDSVNCMLKYDSDLLEGALSTRQDFFYTCASKDEIGPEDVYITKPITEFVPSHFNVDDVHDIFVNENGAVLDAYIFDGSEEEQKEAMNKVLAEKQAMYPEYEFALIPDSFPVGVIGGTMFEGVSWRDKPIMSTHVLYITNYEKYLCRRRGK